MTSLIRRIGLTRLGWTLAFALMLLAGGAFGCLFGRSARAEEPEPVEQRFVPTTRGEMRTLAYDRAAAHGADGEVVWRVVSECEVPSLDPYARGDHGHSHGLAQLGDQQWTGNLLGHFRSLGYDNPYDPWQAFDYLARAFAGLFRYAAWGDVGPHRWSCWWLLYGGRR